jgi:uncharacterized protein with von Willebrand factor type A (vWA) domain
MVVFFHFQTAEGADFVLRLDVNEYLPLDKIIAEATETARDIAGDLTQFVTCELPHQPQGPRSIGEILAPIQERALRLSHVEGSLR